MLMIHSATVPVFVDAGMGLIRFGGHVPKCGYDVHTDGRNPKEATSASSIRRRF